MYSSRRKRPRQRYVEFRSLHKDLHAAIFDFVGTINAFDIEEACDYWDIFPFAVVCLSPHAHQLQGDKELRRLAKAAIEKCLPQNTLHLKLSGCNNIGVNGALVLAQVLAFDVPLRLLNIWNNRIQDYGIVRMGRALAHNTCLVI